MPAGIFICCKTSTKSPRGDLRFHRDTTIASSLYKTYNGTPKVLCREGRTVASVLYLRFQAPPLEWGRVYVEEVREGG